MEALKENVIIFGADMSSSMHIDNKNNDILILVEEPTQGLDDTTLTAEVKYPFNFAQARKRFVLSLHYNRRNSFLFVNASKIYQIKSKNPVIFLTIVQLIIWKGRTTRKRKILVLLILIIF